MMATPSDTTSGYYERNARRYFTATVTADLSDLYRRFLCHVPAGGTILDAGCGAGRDARAFIDRGYQVTAFDASVSLAELAARHSDLPVVVLRIQDIGARTEWTGAFDGVWACASLLHVPLAELPAALTGLCRTLRPGGVLYASFKHGRGEREDDDGRYFSDLDESGLQTLLAHGGDWTGLESWLSDDRRPGRGHEHWFNLLLRKTPKR